MRRSTKRACWKCGQEVDHRRTLSWGGLGAGWFRRLFRPGGYAVAPVKHYVEKRGRFEVCRGSERARRTDTEAGNQGYNPLAQKR